MKLRLTPALQSFLAEHPDEETRAWVWQGLEEDMRTLASLPKGPGRAKALHEMVEAGMARFFDQRPALRPAIRCAKGCGHCCRMWVAVTQDEIELLAQAVQEGVLHPDRPQIARQAGWTPQTYASQTFEAARCCFLDGHGVCTAYELRPASCRAVLVTSSPDLCRDADAATRITAIINPYVEIPRSAALCLEPEDLSLALGLSRALRIPSPAAPEENRGSHRP